MPMHGALAMLLSGQVTNFLVADLCYLAAARLECSKAVQSLWDFWSTKNAAEFAVSVMLLCLHNDRASTWGVCLRDNMVTAYEMRYLNKNKRDYSAIMVLKGKAWFLIQRCLLNFFYWINSTALSSSFRTMARVSLGVQLGYLDRSEITVLRSNCLPEWAAKMCHSEGWGLGSYTSIFEECRIMAEVKLLEYRKLLQTIGILD